MFTVFFGMVPIFLRLIISSFMIEEHRIVLFSSADLIAFGIVLQVSVFNEMKHVNDDDVLWRQLFLGFSAFFMAIFAALYVLTLIAEVSSYIRLDLVVKSSMVLDFTSFLLCWAVYDRMNRVGANNQDLEAP